MKITNEQDRQRGYIFNTIVKELLSRGYSIRVLYPNTCSATFRSQNGDFRVKLDKDNPKLFIIEGRGVNPNEPLNADTTFVIPLDLVEFPKGVVAFIKLKPPSGSDILSFFTLCALLAHPHNLLSIGITSENNHTRIEIDHPQMKLHTFTMEDPTSKRGTYITSKGNTVYRTEPVDIMDWVLYQ